MMITYTFLVGGVIFGIINFLGIKYTISNLIIYNFDFPIGVFVAIVMLMLKIVSGVVTIIKEKFRKTCYIYPIVIKDNGVVFKTSAYWDSGNNVKVEDKGVSIISLGLFLRLYKTIDLQKLYCQDFDNCGLKNPKYITIKGVGRGNRCLSFEIDQLILNNRIIKDVRVAVAMRNFEEYECILYKDMLGGVYEKIDCKD